METKELQTGRELDAMVAERVMGWRWFDVVGRAVLIPPGRLEEMRASSVLYTELPAGPGDRLRQYIDGDYFADSRRAYPMWAPFPSYSTDIAAAWQVVEVMAHDSTRRVMNMPGAAAFVYWWEHAHLWADIAGFAAARICRAALAIMAGQAPV